MAEGSSGLSVLWKTEDWLACWLGFLIIILVLAGVTFAQPKFKWTTDGEFQSFTTSATAALDKLAATAAEKNDTAMQAAIADMKTAAASGDRKAIGEASGKFADAAKAAQDDGLKKKSGELAKKFKDNAGNLPAKVFSGTNFLASFYLLLTYLVLSLAGLMLLGQSPSKFVMGFPVVFIIAWISLFLAGNYSINEYGLEFVLWCLFLGLFVSNVVGVPDWLKPAVQTEFYIKTGLVILGANILFGEILQAGLYSIAQAFFVIIVVWYFCFWLCRKFGIDEEFSAMISSAVSICGVSAAIATSGAIKGDPKKLSYVTSIVLICAVPMLVLQPLIAKTFGMPDLVAGAWLGGTLDTSGSVVAAGALISETAMKIGVIVKMGQNIFIGFAAFALAVWWTCKACAEQPGGGRPSAMEIWERFPKFVLGFMIASVVFSFLIPAATVASTKGMLTGLRTWWFALAFTCIGLETRFSDLAKLGGGKPALAFVIAQGVNIIWTLILAYCIFGGIFFPAPKI